MAASGPARHVRARAGVQLWEENCVRGSLSTVRTVKMTTQQCTQHSDVCKQRLGVVRRHGTIALSSCLAWKDSG